MKIAGYAWVRLVPIIVILVTTGNELLKPHPQNRNDWRSFCLCTLEFVPRETAGPLCGSLRYSGCRFERNSFSRSRYKAFEMQTHQDMCFPIPVEDLQKLRRRSRGQITPQFVVKRDLICFCGGISLKRDRRRTRCAASFVWLMEFRQYQMHFWEVNRLFTRTLCDVPQTATQLNEMQFKAVSQIENTNDPTTGEHGRGFNFGLKIYADYGGWCDC